MRAIELDDCPPIKLDKRQHAPVELEDECPRCATMNRRDLSDGDHHLPDHVRLGAEQPFHFMCSGCEREWSITIVVRLVVSVVEPKPSYEFQERVRALEPARRRELAGEFEVAVSTVDRWARGTAVPHPRLQKQVIDFIKRWFGV